MITCTYCGRTYAASSAYKGHLGHCIKYVEASNAIKRKHLTPEFLRWWFNKKNETALHLANLFNAKYRGISTIHPPYIIALAHSFGIPTNGFSCYKKCTRIHNAYLGTHNVCAKGNSGYVARQARLAQEGITNVYQRPEVKRKIKETLRNRYGVDNPIQLPWYTHNTGMESQPHTRVLSYLQSHSITAISEMKGLPRNLFSKYNNELGKIYTPRPDIVLPEIKVIFEIYGNRWHADPEKYPDDTLIPLWGGPLSARAIREKDSIRKRHLESFGFAVYVIWASQVANGAYRAIVDSAINSHRVKEV